MYKAAVEVMRHAADKDIIGICTAEWPGAVENENAFSTHSRCIRARRLR